VSSILLGEIDKNKKPIEPQIFLLKPNGTIISKLSEAYNKILKVKLAALNEFSFHLPYEIEINHTLQRNHNVDLIRERYILEVRFGTQKERYIINKINNNMDEDKDYMTVESFSLGYELRDKLLRGVVLESKNARQALNEVLSETLWSIDVLDADFELTYRDFDFMSTTVLDAVFSIAETFNAIVKWDTIQRKISLIKPEYTGINRGIKFSYGHYLKTLGKESNADEMVTRLKAFGKDNLSIERVNPTGQNYIEDFSYFMFPFERDENRNVIQSSYYMSDSLCHAILDYHALIENNRNVFNNYLTQLEGLQAQLSQKEIEMDNLKRQESIINDIVLLQQYDNNMWFYKFTFNGSTVLETTKVNPNNAYVVLCKVSDTNNIVIKIDGIQQNLAAGQWVVLEKIKFSNFITHEVIGSATNTEVFIQIANITDEEYNTFSNENSLIEKYSLDNKQMQIAAKQNEINQIKQQISIVNGNIQSLKNLLSVENNFTPEQIQELNTYIIEREFIDENYIDDKDLYKAAQEKFEELRKPQTSFNIDIVNFFAIIEEQHNWNKLYLGDEVIIEYEKLGIKVKAKIIEIEYNFEDSNINLIIANVTEIDDDNKKLADYLKQSRNTSTKVDMGKYKWDQNGVDLGEISKILENFWNKVTNEINMANNEFVTIDRKGITIIDPNDQNRFLRATHGALALTRSGGLRYETAITPDGIIAERLFGKILLTNRVVIGDDDGILEITGPKATITDLCEREVMKFGLYQEDPDKFGILLNRYASTDCGDTNIINQIIVDRDDGFKILRKNGTDWDITAWLDTEGFFNGRGVKIDYMSGTLNNGIVLDNTNGLVITRSDGLYRTKLNATDGISIEKWNGSQWVKKFYVNILDSRLWVEDLVAKRLRIVNDLDDIMIDAETNYLNIGRFETIITDGKLTPIEKLTLKQEWETIQTEYQKLLYQAQQYEYSDRDGRTISHINIPPFTQAYINLGNYVNPLLANMEETTPVDREEFKQKFQSYYDQAKRIINEITDALKYSSVLLGVPYNRVTLDQTNGILVERSDNKYRSFFNATYGILLQKNVNGTWVDQFSVNSSDGVIEARGIRIFGSDVNMLNGVLTNGITIDPVNGIVVTRGDGVVRTVLNATKGIYIQRNGVDVFWADTNGILNAVDLVARRLKIYNNNGTKLLFDGESDTIYLNNMNIEGAGVITSQNIITQTIVAGDGFISNLTVTRLKTLGKEANIGDYVDYIDIKDNYAKWITARVSSKQQARDSKGRLLYWTDSSKQYLTLENTGIIAYEYGFDDVKTKRTIDFTGSGISANPREVIGDGDGQTNVGGYDSGRAYVEKYNGGIDYKYYRSNDAKERSIKLKDEGVYLISEDYLNIECKDLFAQVSGFVKLQHDSGFMFELNETGDTFTITMPNGTYCEYSPTGKTEYIVGDCEINATGNYKINAARIDLN
jgi:phage minor structural protein